MGRNDSKRNLELLRGLVEDLSDRDVKIKRDMRLFEEFFLNFPIPVTIWAITKEGSVISQRGNGLICEDAECLETLFLGNKNRSVCVDMHRDALVGNPRQELITHNRRVFYTSVVPRRNEAGEISGVAGLAWDVSPNYTMIKHLEDIQSITEDKPGVLEKDTKAINSKAKKALSQSRLYKLIKVKEENSES